MYINVYSTTRHYGGPEEGGWWYNWNTCLLTIPVNKLTDKQKKKMIKLLNKIYESSGNIYSVNGGEEIYIIEEDKIAESETTETPYYE